MATDTIDTVDTPIEKKEMRLFKCTLLSCKYTFTDGRIANFVNGKFATQDDAQIAELDREIKKNHPHIYIDKNQITIDYDHTNPLAELRKKFFAEFKQAEAEQLAAQAGRDLGVAIHGPLTGTNTTNIAPVTMGNGPGKK